MFNSSTHAASFNLFHPDLHPSQYMHDICLSSVDWYHPAYYFSIFAYVSIARLHSASLYKTFLPNTECIHYMTQLNTTIYVSQVVALNQSKIQDLVAEHLWWDPFPVVGESTHYTIPTGRLGALLHDSHRLESCFYYS